MRMHQKSRYNFFWNYQMNEFELPPELGKLEQQLASLKPARHQIDSDAILFEAGRQSVLSESSRNMMRPTDARIVASTLFGSVLGTAATILVLFSTGSLFNSTAIPVQDRIADRIPEQTRPSSDEANSELQFEVDSSRTALVNSDPNIRNRQDSSSRRLWIGQDEGVIGQVPVLSTTGLVNQVASQVFEPVKTAAAFTRTNDRSDGTSYWQLMRQMRDDTL